MLYDRLSEVLPSNVCRYIDIESAETESFINQLEWSHFTRKAISVPHWAERIGTELIDNIVYGLAMSNIVSTKVNSKFASVELSSDGIELLGSPKERRKVQRDIFLNKYMPRYVHKQQDGNLTKTPSGVRNTGLVRNGMAYSANQSYMYDTEMLNKYRLPIIQNTIKGMKKVAKKYPHILDIDNNYAEISELIIYNIINNYDQEYNMEANLNDMRGRAIHQGLKRVFNPIGYKDARALLIVSKPVLITSEDSVAKRDIYSFIAELLGKKTRTFGGKALAGLAAYHRRELPSLDLDTKKGRKHLHNLIWLERIYKLLDTLITTGEVMWNIPIEKDATASIAMISGILYNDIRLLDNTNAIYPYKMKDFWSIKGVTNRDGIKAIGTPVGYGSSQSFRKLLKSKNETLTSDEMKAVRQEFRGGAFSIIKRAKDFWLSNCNLTSATTIIDTGLEQFEIECNRTKVVNADLQVFKIFDTKAMKNKVCRIHKPNRIPDLEHFKLFIPVGLIHNLDSWIMDKSILTCADHGEWILGIHDAGMCLPGSRFNKAYVNNLEHIRANRHTIINSYRNSVGAIGKQADIHFIKLQQAVQQCPTTTRISLSCLK